MKDMSENIKQWVMMNGLELLTSLVVFIIVIIVGKIAITIICSITRKALNKSDRVSDLLEGFTINIVNKVLWLVLIMVALPVVGIDVTPLIAGLSVMGFIIGFAFQESLGNLSAGIMILLNNPYETGDYIEAAGNSGTVKDMNIMALTLLTPDNKKIIIPNKAVWGSSIINYSAMETRRVDMVVGVSYTADIDQTKDVISGIIGSHPLILKEPEPLVEVIELADSSVNIVIRVWCKTGDYWKIYFELTRTIKENFDKEGIEIPFPQMDLHVKKIPA